MPLILPCRKCTYRVTPGKRMQAQHRFSPRMPITFAMHNSDAQKSMSMYKSQLISFLNAMQSTKMSVSAATITTDLNKEQAAWEAWRITRVSASSSVHASSGTSITASFIILMHLDSCVFTNQMMLPFPVLDEILRQMAFAV